ncbi:hypothetical protein AB3R30_06415 [Leptolyngbyaceae cyanobacterium UHCC 1019]
MKFLKRDRIAPVEINRISDQDAHVEPAGHVHPNYRHWAWFRPTDLQGEIKR